MITKIEYEDKGNFTISGILRVEAIDFDKNHIDTETFFPLVIKAMINVKKIIMTHLADDNRIISDERVDVIHRIDTFLTLLLSFAFYTSPTKNRYLAEVQNHFQLSIQLNSMRYVQGTGRLFNISSKDIADYDHWIDEKIIGTFKILISLFSDSDNKEKIRDILEELIYNVFSLRFKVEFI